MLVKKFILHILMNLKVNYCAHNILPLVPVLSQINPAHVLPPYVFKVHFNTVFLSTPTASKWSPSFRYPQPKPSMYLTALLNNIKVYQ